MRKLLLRMVKKTAHNHTNGRAELGLSLLEFMLLLPLWPPSPTAQSFIATTTPDTHTLLYILLTVQCD